MHGLPTACRRRRAGASLVVAATLIVAVAAIALSGTADLKIPIAAFGATLFIAAVGFADDVSSIPVLPRLLLQSLAVAVVVFAAPENLQVVPACPSGSNAACCCWRGCGS